MTGTRLPCEEGVIRSVPQHAPRSQRAGAWILTATILGTSLYYIDGNAVNVALPALQRDLHATAAAIQWVYEAYVLLLSALLLVGGSLGALVFNRTLTSHSTLLHLSPAMQQALDAQRSRLAAAQVPSTASPAVRAALRQAIAAAYVAGFRAIMLVSAGLALLGALVIALLVPSGQVRRSEESERHDDAGYRPTEAENEAAPQGLPNRTEKVP